MIHSLARLRMLSTRTILVRSAGALCVLMFLYFVFPPITLLKETGPVSVHIEDRNGEPLYEVRASEAGSYRFTPLADIPSPVIDAFLSIEDRSFYYHPGFSIFAMMRAAWQNFSQGRVISGASTITQQLVRLRLQPGRRTVLYKIREVILAAKLELYRSKKSILESYLNSAYFGHQAYGIGAAANTIFNRSVGELSIAQSALLAGLVQSPSRYDPFRFPDVAKERQLRVLSAMRDNTVVTEEQYQEAIEEPLTYARGKVSIRAPHFVYWLQQQRPEAFQGNGHIQTTIDIHLQTAIERIVERQIEKLKDRRVTSAAVVVLDADNGDLLAMVGSADYFDSEHDGEVNVAVSPRQPGSAIKPFTYALALEAGDTAATTVADVETQFFTQDGNPYIPRNYDYGYHGLVRYREALANSYNIAAVKVLQKVGIASLLDLLRSAGITSMTETPEHYGLALTLGDAEVSLFELTRAYGMLARKGVTLHERLIESDPVLPGRQLLNPQVAWLISDILSDNDARLPEFGTDSPLNFGFPVAVKTGTTRNSRDNWAVGYTPDVIVGVWVGNADNSSMRDTSGVTGAGPIFHDVMLEAVNTNSIHTFTRPEGLNRITICKTSGKLPTPLCPYTIDEWFINGTEPTKPDDLYQEVAIDTRNGLLADTSCTASFVTKRMFTVFPPELSLWARENGWNAPPEEVSPLCGAQDDPSLDKAWLHIISPDQNDSFLLDSLIPDEYEHVILQAEAHGVQSVDWYINGAHIGTAKGPAFRFEWRPSVGRFKVEARAGELRETRSIEVIEP